MTGCAGPIEVCEAFALACDLGYHLGVRSIKDLPGAWVHRVNSDWVIAMNAKLEPVEADPGNGGMKIDVPPGCLVVWWHGWLAGLLDPQGGTLAEHPNGANHARFVADLQAAIDEAKGASP